MIKKSTLLKYCSAAVLFLSACGISTHKLPVLIALNLNIVPLQIFYALFLISFLKLIFDSRKNIPQLLLQSLPTEIVLIIMIFITDSFQTHILHWFFTTTANLWPLLLTTYTLYRYSISYVSKNKNSNNQQKELSAPRFSLLTIIILSIILLVHFSFGFYQLGKEAYVDERLWTYSNTRRIEKYWNNILEADWKNTRPSDKPGVSLAFLSGPSLLFVTPTDFKDTIPDKEAFLHMLFVMRLPILLFSTFILLLFYYILRTLFNLRIALLSTALVGFSPILLGVSRLINPDALSWSIIPLTILSYFNYQKTKKLRWIYLTGILLGWSLLTKYIANLLFLFFILLVFTENILPVLTTRRELKLNIRKSLKSLGIISLIALLTFYIFYPGVWVKPNRLLIGTIWSQPFEPIWQYFVGFIGLLFFDYIFNKSSITAWVNWQLRKLKILAPIVPLIFLVVTAAVLYNVYFAAHPINFENMLTSPKTAIRDATFVKNLNAFVVSFYVLFFGIFPLAFLGVIFTIFLALSKKANQKLPGLSHVWHLFLFIIIFYLASIFSTTIPIVRYQIILYPLILIISAYGWHYSLKSFFKKRFSAAFYILFVIVVLFSISTLYSIGPYYFSYNSRLLPQKYLINLKDMGDGNYAAAQYLNALPNAKNLKIWSDKQGVCRLFVGEVCFGGLSEQNFLKHGPNYDYFVISKGRESRSIRVSEGYASNKLNYPIHMRELYESPDSQADFIVHPGNRASTYIKIIPESKIHVWR